MSYKKFFIPVLIMAVAVVISALLLSTPVQLTDVATERQLPRVRTMEVHPETVRLNVHAQGSVVPRNVSELTPEVDGRVIWLSPALVTGGTFEKGQALLRIDNRDYLANSTKFRAQLARLEAELELAGREYQRATALQKKSLVSEAMQDKAGTEFNRAKAMVDEVKAQLEQAERDYERSEIRAPFNGRVRSETIDIGQYVKRGDKLATIYATDYLEVPLPVSDRQLQYLDDMQVNSGVNVENGPPVTLTANYAGQQHNWHGRIDRVQAEINLRNRMVYLVATIDTRAQASPLPVGLFVNASIEGKLIENIYVIPRHALHDKDHVVVVDKDKQLLLRPVELLKYADDRALVISGLEAGEKINVSALKHVVNGMQVEVEETPTRISTTDGLTL